MLKESSTLNREYSLYWDKSGLKWLSNIVVFEGIADFVTFLH